jgi:hypothetical protein
MPIHINLLAEAQAAEELRRRDPVKRGVFLGASLVALMLVWSGMIQINSALANARLTGVQGAIIDHNKEYTNVLANLNKIAVAKNKLDALNKFESARFLQGNLLNALQLATVDGVQLTRVREEQTYFLTDGTGATTNSDGRVIPSRSGTSRERIVLTLDARDSSANPGGDQMNKFRQVIADQTYFKSLLDKTNSVQLTALSPLQVGPDGRQFELFTVQCNFREQSR